MNLGRNDPCHCGSGKKYKKCCMNQVSTQHSQISDDIETILAMNPNLTLNEINAVLQHKMENHNNQPHPDFCGITPSQMANWLYSPFGELQGVTINTPDDFSESPVMCYLTLIIDEAMQNEGSIKATSKGNLPVKLVKKASGLLPLFSVSKFEKNTSISEFAGSNEDKFNALHYTRVLSEISGFLYRRNGQYHLKKSAQKLYQTQGIQAFFKPMLETAIKKYNWGYLDSFEYDVDIHTFWLFMLWRITKNKNLDDLTREVITAFPDALKAFPSGDYFTPERSLGSLIETRFINRFLQFWGFIIIDPRHYLNGKPVNRMIEVQPLLQRTFQFTLD